MEVNVLFNNLKKKKNEFFLRGFKSESAALKGLRAHVGTTATLLTKPCHHRVM